MTSFTDTEKELVSVERADQYLRNIQEETQDGRLLVKKIIIFKREMQTILQTPSTPPTISCIYQDVLKHPPLMGIHCL